VTSRYDELSERARFFLENWDELDLAEMCASGEATARQTKAAIARIRTLHQQYRSVYDDATDSCAHCNQISGDVIPWPCPTIDALNGAETQP
jgi:hypothetical protein